VSLDKSRRPLLLSERVTTTFSCVTRRELPQRRPEAVAKLLRATERAIGWARGHRPETIAIMGRRLGLDARLSEAILDDFRFGLPFDEILLLALAVQARSIRRSGPDASTAPPNDRDFVDPSMLAAVKPGALA
jgi:ABC-type nitrate/sulfonate/bicarbonate transport system substrate-binding protein